ncbi:hypothetical protein CEK26_011342 [Fusarium fujikuroi]|nr:hypothetical protein CEK27_011361 [Fusarium fujikuroi]QGI84617.1 hypothetical protein CEK25_011346 [Fusarium fujikuroi]QGI98273.1 hypothetical protein CEK26_011342 [Fusarium fujikuroi]VZH88710.1 unnamed protein product [Fusarium fujikuroi]
MFFIQCLEPFWHLEKWKGLVNGWVKRGVLFTDTLQFICYGEKSSLLSIEVSSISPVMTATMMNRVTDLRFISRHHLKDSRTHSDQNETAKSRLIHVPSLKELLLVCFSSVVSMKPSWKIHPLAKSLSLLCAE